jgi:capsid protein
LSINSANHFPALRTSALRSIWSRQLSITVGTGPTQTVWPLAQRCLLLSELLCVTRSCYEFDNNSWYSGILRTAANHIIGCGPRLQVLTTDTDANTRLEKAWMKWSRQVMLAAKLRMMFETYWKDGEVFAMRISRPSRWPISLDIRTFEAEQCAAPWIGSRVGDPYVDDGVRTDPSNNEVEYHFYKHHPGDVAFNRNSSSVLWHHAGRNHRGCYFVSPCGPVNCGVYIGATGETEN